MPAVRAQQIYKYEDDQGNWVFSDRQPDDGRRYERIALADDGNRAGVWLTEERNDNGELVLVAINGFLDWVQIAFRLEFSRNVGRDVPTAGNRLLSPESETELLVLQPADPSLSTEVRYRYQYVHGHPGARHAPERPYRAPYRLARAHRVTQAYPDALTHTSAANRYAFDFDMPIGTAVHAAREGVVVEVAEDFLSAGLDPDDKVRANFVRILHDDGTLGLYGHLNRRSIQVEPGERVARGQHIADSGNTGFSSGPHLHFVVQRNGAGAVESVPISFVGSGGDEVVPRTGDRIVAY